jgi:hypothetical protein
MFKDSNFTLVVFAVIMVIVQMIVQLCTNVSEDNFDLFARVINGQ